jgi:hypothetical protein
MALFVLEVLAGLEVDGMAQVFPFFENVNDGRGTPAVNIFDRLGSVHTLVKSCQMYRWNLNFVLGEPGGDLIGAVARQRHGEDTADNGGDLVIHNPVFPLFVPKVAVNHCPSQMLAAHALGLEYRLDFTARITGVKLIHDIPSVDKKDAVCKLIEKQHSRKIKREYFGLTSLNIPTLSKVIDSVLLYRFKIPMNLVLFVIN